MSLDALSWASRQRIKPVQKLTLMMLANRHNRDTGQCNPSHARLAEDCGLSGSGVKKALKELSDLGLIRIIATTKDSVKLPNQYILNLHLNITVGDLAVGHEVTGGGSCGDWGVGHEVTIKQEVKPVNEPVSYNSTANHEKQETKNKGMTFTQKYGNVTNDEVIDTIIPVDSKQEKLIQSLELSIEAIFTFCIMFRDRHTDKNSKSSKKKYTNWDAVICNAIRNNWFNVWAVDRGGQYYMTSSARTYHDTIGLLDE